MEVERAQLAGLQPFIRTQTIGPHYTLSDRLFRFEVNNVLHSFRDSYKSIGESLPEPSNGMISHATQLCLNIILED